MDADKATPEGTTTESAVRQRYRAHRYLQDLSDEEVRQLWRDAFRNLMTINADGKAAPLPRIHPRHRYWRVRMLHLAEEFTIRFGPYPNGFDDSLALSIKMPRPESMRNQRAAAAVDCRSLVRGSYLVKYGQKAHISEMLDKGLVRIAPASSYAAFESNDAIADTELKFTFNFFNCPPEIIAEHATVPSHFEAKEPFEGTAFLERTLREDYFLFCLSASYDARLFDDFESDACLIIHSPIEFRERLMWRVAEKVQSKGWAFSDVTYVDPFSVPDPTLHPSFRKHHRYTYQDEVRAAWQMHKGQGRNLEVLFVELGCLRELARVVTIEGN